MHLRGVWFKHMVQSLLWAGIGGKVDGPENTGDMSNNTVLLQVRLVLATLVSVGCQPDKPAEHHISKDEQTIYQLPD